MGSARLAAMQWPTSHTLQPVHCAASAIVAK